MDDNLVWGEEKSQEAAIRCHDRRLYALLRRCEEMNIKLNYEKLQVGKTELKYMGMIQCQQGVKADPKKQEAIMPQFIISGS